MELWLLPAANSGLQRALRTIAGGPVHKNARLGVGTGVNKAILARELGLHHHSPSLFDCCVELEFQAGDTRGNALATQSWTTRNQIRSVLLVTANYHMPRAARIFTRQMPKIRFIFWPVSPDDFNLQNWWHQTPILRLLGREYAKYLAESIRRTD